MADNTTTTPTTSARDAIRAQVLGKTHELKSKEVTFFEAKIELRQPTLGQTLSAQGKDDREAAVIDMLIKQAYVPKTDILVFEDGDAEVFKTMPFGSDFLRVSQALEELSDVNFLDGSTDSAVTVPST